MGGLHLQASERRLQAAAAGLGPLLPPEGGVPGAAAHRWWL